MPDMSKPGAEYMSLLSTLKFKARDCFEKAHTLQTQGQVYSEAASDLESAIDREAEKHSSAGGPK
jgi:hypothetical protein